MKIVDVGLSSVIVALSESEITSVQSVKQGQVEVPFKQLSNHGGERLSVEVNIKDFSIYEDLVVCSESDEVSLSDVFLKYRLDCDRLSDEFYVTGAIVNASTRGLTNNELFFVAYNALSIMPSANHFYGSLITLISYKYLEAPEYRGWILDVLVEAKKGFDSAVDRTLPNVVRWGISSTTALSLALLLNDRTESANAIVDVTIQSYEPHLNQLSYWNYCLCLILKATMLRCGGDAKAAGWKYLAAFEFSRKSINDIYHGRNDWVLGQLSDCHALLNLGELAIKCAAKSLGKIPPESRYADLKYSGKIVFSAIFSRFQNSRIKFNSKFFDGAEKLLSS
ncbi:hypothetical protein [Pseudomonas putida]|uniref:Uncharacterized protein n=1 Tax=Pseudomonas putida TaxID=303 RepID=A0A6I6XWU1_PSEPU|nr:hypothetical protein [Pseudomonas putida]QHG63840.1 hypothetical protein C2H86_05125 [Pseudomonas putida]